MTSRQPFSCRIAFAHLAAAFSTACFLLMAPAVGTAGLLEPTSACQLVNGPEMGSIAEPLG